MSMEKGATKLIIVAKSPTEILRQHPPTRPEGLDNAYELKTKPERVQFYHAAAGFPTKSTWLKAIHINQYASWPGLIASDAAKYYPELGKVWKGYRRKI